MAAGSGRGWRHRLTRPTPRPKVGVVTTSHAAEPGSGWTIPREGAPAAPNGRRPGRGRAAPRLPTGARAGAAVALAGLEGYARLVVGRPLRPYQLEPGRAIG